MPPATLVSLSKPLSERHLSFADQEEIGILRAHGHEAREIARRLGQAISRKLQRDAATCGSGLDDWALPAQWHAERAVHRPKLAVNAALRCCVRERHQRNRVRSARVHDAAQFACKADDGCEARMKHGPALAGHGAEAVSDAITRTVATLPEPLRRSLT